MMFGRAASVAAFASLGGTLALLYLAFFDRVDPIQYEELLNAEGLGIGPSAEVAITRRICLSRAAEAESFRVFRKLDRGQWGAEEVVETLPIRVYLEQGCQVRTRRIDVPDTVEAGRYEFRVGVRFCNNIGNCQTRWLGQPMTVLIEGELSRRRIRIERDT